MPLDDLQNEIIEEARRKARRMEDEARKTAAARIKEANEEARRIMKEASASAASETKMAKTEQESSSELQETNAILNAREEAVESVLPKIRDLVIKGIKAKGYRRIFDDAVEKAVELSPIEDLTFIVNKADEKFVKGLGGKVENGNVSNGVIIHTSDGSIKIVATIDSMFDQKLPEIKSYLTKNIFEKGHMRSAPAKQAGRQRSAMKKVAKKQKRAVKATKPKRAAKARARRRRR